MSGSRQMTSALAVAVVLSAVGPGVAGYVSARLEGVDAAERRLRALEDELRAREHAVRPVSFPEECARPHEPHWLPEFLEAWERIR
ncbi:hypothetical protein ACQEUU_04990 [Nonomuraea sp. CA-218870]|uniref:hypothetical protein n=1 Tax=Nonomuraea sp. CA-218870 TaxID=3239998 RepID=UPI003D8DBCDA